MRRILPQLCEDLSYQNLAYPDAYPGVAVRACLQANMGRVTTPATPAQPIMTDALVPA